MGVRAVALAGLALALGAGCDGSEAAGRGGSSGPVLAMAAEDPGALWELAPFELSDQRGASFGTAELAGRPWAAAFVFTRCAGPCPRISADMRWLQDQLAGTRAELVSISVDPRYDTPEVLAGYASSLGADPARWHFLTGEQTAVWNVVQKGFLQPLALAEGRDGAPGEPTHGTALVVVDAALRVRGVYETAERGGRARALERLRFLDGEALPPAPAPEGNL